MRHLSQSQKFRQSTVEGGNNLKSQLQPQPNTSRLGGACSVSDGRRWRGPSPRGFWTTAPRPQLSSALRSGLPCAPAHLRVACKISHNCVWCYASGPFLRALSSSGICSFGGSRDDRGLVEVWWSLVGCMRGGSIEDKLICVRVLCF